MQSTWMAVATTGVIEGVAMPVALAAGWLRVCSARKCRRSSAMSLRRRVALRGPLRQGFQADAFQFLRDAVVALAGRAGLEARHLLQQFRLRVGPERLASHQQFVEDHAQAENVAAAIDPMPFATGLLGTHVGGRPGVASAPCRRPASRKASPKSATNGLPLVVEQDVARLDVPMHQSLLVGVVQRLGHRRHQFDRFVEREPGLLEPSWRGRCRRCTSRRRSRDSPRCCRHHGRERCSG